MSILTVQGLTKSHGLKQVFSDLSFGIERRDRVGVIGINGSGKSTLLKILAGLDTPDAGGMELRQDMRIEFLPQNPVFDADHTVIEHIFFSTSEMAAVVREYELISHRLADGTGEEGLLRRLDEVSRKMDAMSAWEYETRAETILTKLGVVDFEAKVGTLSGGYRKRVALARVLLDESDILILDEPTNHLDADTVAWLEGYLQKYNGTVLLVTHDRYFLDRVTQRIFEIDQGTLRQYEGNFSYYLERKTKMESACAAQETKRRSILRKELEWLKRGAKARRTKQKARIDRIGVMASSSFYRPKEEIRFGVSARRLGTKVVELKDIAKSFDGKKVIEKFSYTIERGQRLGIIGPNGCGKSTLANLITGKLPPDSGSVVVGETVYFGYYDQESLGLNPFEKAIDYVKREGGELIRGVDGKMLTAAAAMEEFLFTSQMMYSPIEKLSGGERRRLYLVRTLMKDPNFLILDEPTNDLDIATLESLEDFLDSFGGSLLIISHDRYFLDRTVDQLISFEGDGVLRTYPGNYTDYERIRAEIAETDKEKQGEIKKALDAKKKKDVSATESNLSQKLSFNERKEFAELEKAILNREEQLKSLEGQMIAASTDYVKLKELSQEHARIKSKLTTDSTRWEELASRSE
ncbi:MAG: ABC-F family ATP-binding cassette domain-containing protein [Phycisphaerae bacterium]